METITHVLGTECRIGMQVQIPSEDVAFDFAQILSELYESISSCPRQFLSLAHTHAYGHPTCHILPY